MEIKNLQFKTNLNCGGCVSKVREDMDHTDGIMEWSVDTEDPDKILTVKSAGISREEVIAILRKKGFKAEPVSG